MGPIGGYFELELRKGDFPHSNEVLLNSASHALQFIVQQLGVTQIYIPAYTCPVVPAALRAVNCSFVEYNLTPDLYPAQDFPLDAFILYNNYFGVCDAKVQELAVRYPNLIVDNAQAFYASPCGIASFYSPRKFFGVPDGGMACFRPDIQLAPFELPASDSYDRCSHLLKRIDLSAESAYVDFKGNEECLARTSMASMSPLTQAILGNIDYDFVAIRRCNNFDFLHSRLSATNMLPMKINTAAVPLVYPYLVHDGSRLKRRLLDERIFCPTYWPDVKSGNCIIDNLKLNLVCIPCDQRYDVCCMNHVLHLIMKYYDQ